MTSKYFSNYFLRKGYRFEEFWKEYFSTEEKNVLFILGLGFDPRALTCLEIINKSISKSKIVCMPIEYNDDFKGNRPLSEFLKNNVSGLESIFPRKDWISKKIEMNTEEAIISLEAVKILEKCEIDGFSDIIIDISSMPNGVFFPLIRTILDWINKDEIKSDGGKKINLHLVVAENAAMDAMIKEVAIKDKVTYMYKFASRIQSEAKSEFRKVWIPLLGENQSNQLDKINQEVSPNEVCPIFPSPSIEPYRSKNLLLEHREFLFDTLGIDTRNFVYANEKNPFEVFRRIYDISLHYFEAFQPLGGCTIIISPLSSKLFSVGALLASCELLDEGADVGIVHVENQTYDILGNNIDQLAKSSIPFTMWLAGEAYSN